ncbi:hypothetical protein [Ruegeria atlantica]|uniref:hypothetical protein n=1 Tax=Ruegeria atlantica TaxID=81569 RepID=UPI002493F2C1|nr:hypothetical protein [Ruegeria atlantica]
MVKKTRVVFLHRKGLSGAGSKIMRCDQLSALCSYYLGDEFEFTVVTLRPMRSTEAFRQVCSNLQDCIVIMLKGTWALFGDNRMLELRRYARAVCVDYVDSNVRTNFARHAQVHVAASKAGAAMLEELVVYQGAGECAGRVMHLTHHADPRLSDVRCTFADVVQVGYLGHPANAFLTDRLRQEVHVLSYENDREIGDVFEGLRGFNMHYAVRALPRRKEVLGVFKPFTKGFTAAVLGANVLTTRHTTDAVHYLGEDYPFLLDRTDEDSVLTALDRARYLYGTSAWDEATERMRHVRQESSPERIAQEMREILSDFT